MQKTLILISLMLLCGCVSSLQPRAQALNFYDFGLQQDTLTSTLPIYRINAIDAINHHRIRYRLSYQNPEQVFTYAESRWSALPTDLLSLKSAGANSNDSSQTQCRLRLEITAFDQVFDSPDSSYGLVQLNATLLAQDLRKPLAEQRFTASATAGTADAKGGVQALNLASSDSLQQAFDWGQQTAGQQSECR